MDNILFIIIILITVVSFFAGFCTAVLWQMDSIAKSMLAKLPKTKAVK